MATMGRLFGVFDEDVGQLRGLVAEMGGLAEAAIDGALQALADRDEDAATRIVEADARIDQLETEVEREVVRLMARKRPSPKEVRDILVAAKVAGVVERMGDYAKNIAKRVPLLAGIAGLEPLSVLPAMGKLAAAIVRDALDAYAARDPARAVAVCEADRAIDDFYNSVFRTLLTYMMENPSHISPSAHLLFIAKNLERIGDHATNVAEMVHFAATGRRMDERVKGREVTAQEGGA